MFYAIYLTTGLLAGIVGGLPGMGGCALMLGGGYALVPSYIYLLRAPVKIAIGASIITPCA